MKVSLILFSGYLYVNIACIMLGTHVVHVSDEALDVVSHLLDGVIDESLLAREFLEWCLEIALTEGLDAGHGLLLHRDVAEDHVVHTHAHGLVGALELLGGDLHIDVSRVVLRRHGVHLGD